MNAIDKEKMELWGYSALMLFLSTTNKWRGLMYYIATPPSWGMVESILLFIRCWNIQCFSTIQWGCGQWGTQNEYCGVQIEDHWEFCMTQGVRSSKKQKMIWVDFKLIWLKQPRNVLLWGSYHDRLQHSLSTNKIINPNLKTFSLALWTCLIVFYPYCCKST